MSSEEHPQTNSHDLNAGDIDASNNFNSSSNLSSYSNDSTNEGRRRKSKSHKTITPLTIEDVFNKVSTITANVLNPPLKRIVLTPRSAQSCLKLGVNPELLKIRDLDSFWELGIDPAVQRMRHEAYVQRRHELMKQCRSERRALINAEFENPNKSLQQTTITAEMLLQAQKEQTSTLIKMELERINKMQKRQEKELEQMIQHEITRAKIAEDMAQKLEEEKRKEELKKKRREKRMRLLAEERRLHDLQRAALEETEEQRRRDLAREMHTRERTIAEQAERKRIETKRRLQEEEIEKKRINDEHRRQLQEYFEGEKRRLRERLASMQSAEQKKQEALALKQQEHAIRQRLKREQAEKRIEQNITMAQQAEEKRKLDFMTKQERFEMKRSVHLQRLEEARQLQIQETYLQEQRRQMILVQQRKDEERKAQELLGKFDEEEEHIQQIALERQKEQEIMKEKKVIKLEIKKENFERVARVKEYNKIGVLKRIEDTDSRVKNMLDQRRQLIAERRKAAADTKRQKEAITKVMEEVRSNATKASLFVADAIAGKLSITDIAKGSLPSATGTSGVASLTSSSGGKRKSRKNNKSLPSSAELLGFSQHRSARSAPGQHTDDEVDQLMDEVLKASLDKKGTESHKKSSFLTDDEVEPMPYKSPYLDPLKL